MTIQKLAVKKTGATFAMLSTSKSPSPACDPPTQQSSHTGDDAITAAGYQTVIPAQAGIQRLYSTNGA
jgi:hypothetical protein